MIVFIRPTLPQEFPSSASQIDPHPSSCPFLTQQIKQPTNQLFNKPNLRCKYQIYCILAFISSVLSPSVSLPPSLPTAALLNGSPSSVIPQWDENWPIPPTYQLKLPTITFGRRKTIKAPSIHHHHPWRLNPECMSPILLIITRPNSTLLGSASSSLIKTNLNPLKWNYSLLSPCNYWQMLRFLLLLSHFLNIFLSFFLGDLVAQRHQFLLPILIKDY